MAPEYCSNCGASLASGANYCSECGEAIGGGPADPAGESNATDSWDDSGGDDWYSSEGSSADGWDDRDDAGGWNDPETSDDWQSTGESDGWTDEESWDDDARASDSDTTLAAITHVLALFTWVIGPLIVLVASDDAFVTRNAKNALNWQIMLTVFMFVSTLLLLVVVGLLFLLVLPVVNLIVCVVAAIKASDGEAWSYPATPRIL